MSPIQEIHAFSRGALLALPRRTTKSPRVDREVSRGTLVELTGRFAGFYPVDRMTSRAIEEGFSSPTRELISMRQAAFQGEQRSRAGRSALPPSLPHTIAPGSPLSLV